MSYKTSSCVLCARPKPITAEQLQWQIHLARHREDLIKYLASNFPYCVICDPSIVFQEPKNLTSHLRWYHSKKSLIDWFYKHVILGYYQKQ